MLAPILAFTADEAWEFIPGKPTGSVHEAIWQPKPFVRSEAETAAWTGLFKLREKLLPELEMARQAKTIGKSLEARAILRGTDQLLVDAKAHLEYLRELANVSQLEVELIGNGVTDVEVVRADGQKCERCWHWEMDIGLNAEHSTICGRCIEAVKHFAAK